MGDTVIGEGGQEDNVKSQNTGSADNNGASHWSEALDPDVKTWVAGMGLDKVAERDALSKIIPMYRGAEQKLGVPADQLLKLPGKDAKPEDWRNVWNKLGAPEKPDGYEIKVPEGDSGEFVKTASGWFYEAGITKGQANQLSEKWNSYVQSQQEAYEAKITSQADKDIEELKGEWSGDEYDKNVSLAQRVRRTSGLSEEEAIKIERAIGVKRSAMVFANLGKSLGEHRFVGGGEGTGFSMSPESARARINELRKDQSWMAAYLGGDADKKSEFTHLMRIANPEQTG